MKHLTYNSIKIQAEGQIQRRWIRLFLSKTFQANVVAVSTVKFGWLEWQVQVLLERSYIFVIGKNQWHKDALKTSKAFSVVIDCKWKVGWINFLFDEWLKKLDKKFEKENHKSNYWKFESCGACIPAIKHNFKNTTYGPMCATFPKKKYNQKIIQRLIRAVDMKKRF